jgi:Zn-finger nucleic acid-binding protein
MEWEKKMRCPVDNETLVIADRGGVEIDYCPKCRGVWLDRGELDKIIDRSMGEAPAPARAAPAPMEQPVRQQAAPVYQPEPRAPQGYREDDRRRRDDDDDDYRGGHKKKRRESFLGELFDF